jgi:hypothetical protein
MSSGRGGAGNVRLNTGSGLKGKGRVNEDTDCELFWSRNIDSTSERTLAPVSRLVNWFPRNSMPDTLARR